MLKNLIFCALIVTCLACESNPNANTANSADSGEQTTQKNRPTPNKYSVSPFAPSASYADAQLSEMTYKGGKFNFNVSSKSYKLGAQTPDADQKMCANSGKGQHIHMIIDNKPYLAKYTSSFEAPMEDGEHYTMAFLSRSYHESIKTDQANIAKKVQVKDGAIVKEEDVDLPMLFYSRPKGTYIGAKDTEKIMLDFYLKNVKLGPNFKVKADINGEIHMLDKWQPYYIEGLPMGENSIELTLVDKEGNRIPTPLNPVKRTFTLKADPVE